MERTYLNGGERNKRKDISLVITRFILQQNYIVEL